jgi:hypothetical protein
MDRETVEAIKRQLHESVEEIKRQFHVVAEALRGEMRTLAEGLAANTDRLDRFEAHVAGEFVETRAMIRLSYGELERRIQVLESRA